MEYAANDINDICKINKKELRKYRGKVRLVAGGPLCQGFSSAGQRNEGDVRNKLVDSYLDFVYLVRPEMIFLRTLEVLQCHLICPRMTRNVIRIILLNS